jgi:YD repeat-containing protein
MHKPISRFGKTIALGLFSSLVLPAFAAAQNTFTYAYDSNFVPQGPVIVTPGTASTITHQYDANSNVILDISVPNSALGDTNRYQYDPAGNVLSTTTTPGSGTASTYDSGNGGVSLTDAIGSDSSLYTYDSMGILDDLRGPLGLPGEVSLGEAIIMRNKLK